MSRITNEIADKITDKLSEPKKKIYDEATKNYKALVKKLYQAQTPASVISEAIRNPNWFYYSNEITFGHGFNFEKVYVEGNVISNGNGRCYLNPDKATAKEIRDVKNMMEKEKEGYRAFKTEVNQALHALRTFKRIREELPAAAQYLPPEYDPPAVNFKPLNKKLEKLLQTKN